ncbi:ABC transporter substrate-binding protein [Candidatus Leptofilum sp.]|uniref:ABC transporter substrate-binding protein n=1 Tax=Candidatus Leptofilum sp. TaxID=3241576 RepID=UPI003B5B5671
MKKDPLLYRLSNLILLLLVVACGAEEAELPTIPVINETVIYHQLWDGNQLPAYAQCATDFMNANPTIRIELLQTEWGLYWEDISRRMEMGTAPDVFANHLTKLVQFSEAGQLLDLQPLLARDGLNPDDYLGDLANLWVRDGLRYGLPKDWDTVAVIYNKQMLEAAAIDLAELNSWHWNPQDGGSFEAVAARLTLDGNGRSADTPDFDPQTVTQHGYLPFTYGSGSAFGQAEWSHFAVSNGFHFLADGSGIQYRYADPQFIETVDWLARLSLEKGIAPSLAESVERGSGIMFVQGEGAMIVDGSWMISWYANNAPFPVGFAPLPVGPNGRKTLLNTAADSIWAGTQNREEAWRWVTYAASPACAQKVGNFGVVFPAQEAGMQAALATYQGRGLDVSPFTENRFEANGTFLFPMTPHTEQIGEIMSRTLDEIFLGTAVAAEALPQANAQINALFAEQ